MHNSIYNNGGKYIKKRLSKARNSLKTLINLWRYLKYSFKNKLKQYLDCLLTALYVSECWRMAEWPKQTFCLTYEYIKKKPRNDPAKQNFKWRTVTLMQTGKHGHHTSEKEMEMDRACSQNSLVRNNKLARHMGYHPQVGPDYTRVEDLHCCPVCQLA